MHDDHVNVLFIFRYFVNADLYSIHVAEVYGISGVCII